MHSGQREEQGPRLWGDNGLDKFQAWESYWGWSPGPGKRGQGWDSQGVRAVSTSASLSPSKDFIIDSTCEGQLFNWTYLFLCFLARKWFDLISFLKTSALVTGETEALSPDAGGGRVWQWRREKKGDKTRVIREEVTTLISSKEMAGA